VVAEFWNPTGLRALDVPEEPVARLWHAATLLREHRGDGHNPALVAHVLMSLSLGMRAEEFDRTHHLPDAQLAGVCRRAAPPRPRRRRRLVHRRRPSDQDRVEALTNELAAPAYDALTPDELNELVAGLKPIPMSSVKRPWSSARCRTSTRSAARSSGPTGSTVDVRRRRAGVSSPGRSSGGRSRCPRARPPTSSQLPAPPPHNRRSGPPADCARIPVPAGALISRVPRNGLLNTRRRIDHLGVQELLPVSSFASSFRRNS
jgi:hypothetical protein